MEWGELWAIHSLVQCSCFFFISLATFMQLRGSIVEVLFVNNNSNLFRLNNTSMAVSLNLSCMNTRRKAIAFRKIFWPIIDNLGLTLHILVISLVSSTVPEVSEQHSTCQI